jgi:hypothetical protein
MAEGIRKRHSKACNALHGKRCNCKAGWEASIYLAREGRKLRRTFARESEARTWRADTRAAATTCTPNSPSRITVGPPLQAEHPARIRPRAPVACPS